MTKGLASETIDTSGGSSHGGERAIVVGTGVAGLCAAAALSHYFAKVVLVERDALATSADHRAGVPQGRHAHVLMGRGARELERLFPGFAEEMINRGAKEIDWQRDLATLQPQGWLRRNDLRTRHGLTLIMSSRLLTESVIRDRVRALSNVQFLEKTVVTALRIDDRKRVCGVRMQSRGSAVEEHLPAALVVDASGRSSKAPDWLRESGLGPPDEEIVDAGIGYASRWYRKPPGAWPEAWWWKGMWVESIPPKVLFGGAMFPIEDDCLIVTLAGFGADRPPSGEADFNTFMQRLRTPLFAEAVEKCEPISKVHAFRDMPNRLRMYHRWSERVVGFIAVGDSVCSLNPIYAQGMSLAATTAGVLRDSLERRRSDDPEFAPQFFKAQAGLVGAAWGIATGADFSYPTVVGTQPFIGKLLAPYFQAYFKASYDDRELNLLFDQVTQLLRLPTALMEPRIMLKVLLGQFKSIVRHRRNDVAELPPGVMAFT